MRYLYLIKEPISPLLRMSLAANVLFLGILIYLCGVEIGFIGWLGGFALFGIDFLYGIYKIGITNTLSSRIAQLNTGNSRKNTMSVVSK